MDLLTSPVVLTLVAIVVIVGVYVWRDKVGQKKANAERLARRVAELTPEATTPKKKPNRGG